ncbi:MAG: exosortase/archaeosortase family protein, partial [Verrucomicrobiota bacterium]|nr:exosortase/archaeosortase family protein [Verrucomicrobiota bacterium]
MWVILCRQLSNEWAINEQYSYGWFVPFFAAYLFWLRWEDRPDHRERAQNRMAAAFVIFFALILLVPIRLFEIGNPDWRPLGKSAAPHDWLLAAQLHLQQGAADKALDSLGKIFTNPGATSREEFQATVLQLQAAHTNDADLNQRAQKEAWERLTKLAQSDDAVALDSLVLLAQRQLSRSGGTTVSSQDGTAAVPPPEELVRHLESHPLAKAPQKLLAVDLEIQAHPDEKEALVRQAIDQWKNSDASQLSVLATWLNGKGEFQRQLDEIPEEKALGSRDLFLQRMDALGALDRWDEIDRLLDSERFPLDPVMQHMYLARANAQLGQEAASKNSWQRALEAAAGDAGKLITLGEYAEKNGATEIA